MASLAEKRKADAEERSIDPQARPEELRLLEALLFASTEPLDQATLAKHAKYFLMLRPNSAGQNRDNWNRNTRLITSVISDCSRVM